MSFRKSTTRERQERFGTWALRHPGHFTAPAQDAAEDAIVVSHSSILDHLQASMFSPALRWNVFAEIHAPVRQASVGKSCVLSVTHEPNAYACPFCGFQRGILDERNQPSDVVAVTERAFARIAPKWWPGNAGAVLVIPRVHVENIYGLTPEDGQAVWDLTQRVTVGIRSAYGCEGTSIRQHNEPAGDQDVWHLHVHVFPRYEDDDLYLRHDQAEWVVPEAREPYAAKLRKALGMPFSFDDATAEV